LGRGEGRQNYGKIRRKDREGREKGNGWKEGERRTGEAIYHPHS